MLAKTLKGFALSRRLAKGSHFWADARQTLERVRAFAETSKRVRAFAEESQRVRTFGYLFERVCTFPNFPAWAKRVHSYRRRCAARPSEGFGLLRGSSQWFVLLGTTSPNIRKGSHLRRRFVEGSHFRAHAHQNLKRVRASGEDTQRVRASGHALAEASKGFALWARICKGFALLAKVRKGFALLGLRPSRNASDSTGVAPERSETLQTRQS